VDQFRRLAERGASASLAARELGKTRYVAQRIAQANGFSYAKHERFMAPLRKSELEMYYAALKGQLRW
jgi:hypothetical protein